jgi:hypothetical protein
VNVGKVLLAFIALWIPIPLAVRLDHSRASFYSLQSDKSVEDFASLTTEQAFVKALMVARVPGGIVRKVDCKSKQPKPRLFPSTLALQQTIELIRVTDPQYRSLTTDGVINLLPNPNC